MKDIWNRFENWINQNANKLSTELNEGASDDDIKKLSDNFGLTFPEDFIDFYKIHNGQSDKWDSPALINNETLLSTRMILKEWSTWKNLLDEGSFPHPSQPQNSEIRNDWWNPGWIPITTDDSGMMCCLDFAPTEEGNKGQVIGFDSQSSDRVLLANSFRSWIENYVTELENGKYAYSEDWCSIIDIEMI